MNTNTLEQVHRKIYTIRGVKVMLDRDLAALYGVTTGNLNKAVRRNNERFPDDFMFQLTKEELKNWVFQIGRPNTEKMGMRIPPHVFTEPGVAMLSSVLKSTIAIEVNIRIMRAFIELRNHIAATPEYALLKEQIRRIESDVLVQNKLVDGKLIQLGTRVSDLSITLDSFQDAHIVIKRPDSGENVG